MIEIHVVEKQWVISWLGYTEKRVDCNSIVFKDLRKQDIIGFILTLKIHVEAQLLSIYEKHLNLKTHRKYSSNENKKKTNLEKVSCIWTTFVLNLIITLRLKTYNNILLKIIFVCCGYVSICARYLGTKFLL